MRIEVDGNPVDVPEGSLLAPVLLAAGTEGFAPLCGMGICFQCRVTVDGVAHVRSCQVVCREGMEVRTR